MKELNRVSLAFLLIDMFTKVPIIRAKIKCNGEVIPYTRKSNGYYVFVNILDKEYDFEISCDGYYTINKKIKVGVNNPIQYTLLMQSCLGDVSLYSKNKVIFDVKKSGKPFANQNVKLRLDTKVVFLKMISPIQKGNNLVEINYDYNTNLLFQEYYYDKNPNFPVFFVGYDLDEKKYRIKEKSDVEVEKGGYLCPVWELKTDHNGRLLFPINSFFISKETANFTLIANSMESSVSINVSRNTEVVIELKNKFLNSIKDENNKKEESNKKEKDNI